MPNHPREPNLLCPTLVHWQYRIEAVGAIGKRHSRSEAPAIQLWQSSCILHVTRMLSPQYHLTRALLTTLRPLLYDIDMTKCHAGPFTLSGVRR